MFESLRRQQQVRPMEQARMSHNGMATKTLRAMWPSEALEAVKHIGHARQHVWLGDKMASMRANAGAASAADKQTEDLECLVQDDYERLHADDTFGDLKRRARFSKEDKGVLRDWLALAERRDRALVAGGATQFAAE